MPNPASLDYNLIKPNFTAGELSPRMAARIDLEKYFQGCDTLENFLIYPQGGIFRRPGTRFVAIGKNPADDIHIIPFRFSSVQNYVIELGNLYARFYRNGGQIQVASVPVEIVTPYVVSDTNLIKWAQSADTLYLAHSTYHPQKLTRTSDTTWNIQRIDFLDGPYLDANIVTTAKLAPSVTTNAAGTAITNCVNNAGLIRVTSNAHGRATNDWVKIVNVLGTTEANGYWQVTVINANTVDLQGSVFTNAYVSGGNMNVLPTLTASGTNKDGTAFAPFVTGPSLVLGQFASSGSGHVGSSWRFSSAGTTFGWCKIVNVNSTTVAVIDIRGNFDATTASSFWREGAWSGVRGYPGCCTIQDQRLIWANNTNEPQKMWASRANDYENHVPQFTSGTTVDSDAWVYKLGTQLVNPIMWMTNSSRGLLVGTTGEEHIGSGSSGQGPITPTSVWFRVQTSHGSLNTVLPARVGYETMFVTRTGLKLRAAAYSLLQDVYVAPDRTIFSEHISYLNLPTSGIGFAHMTYAQEPNSDLWLSRNDGQVCVLTYVLEQNIAGWSRHTMEAGAAQVTSLTAIPATNLAADTPWFVVQRTVNGSITHYIEYSDSTVNTDCASTLDNTQSASLTLSSTAPGTGITATAGSAIFSAGNVGQEIVALPAPSNQFYPIPGSAKMIIPGSVPATQSGGTGRATITGYTDPTHVTVTITNAFANTAITGGQWGIGSFSFTGLTNLIGKTVNLVGDGAVYPSVVVDGTGKVTVPSGQPSIVSVEIGLPFTATFISMRPDPKSGGETIQADKKRWDKVKIRVRATSDITVDGTELLARDFTMAAGVQPGLLTGDLLLPNAGTWDFDARITISQPNPVFTAIDGFFGRLDSGPI